MEMLDPRNVFKDNDDMKNFFDILLESFKSLENDTDTHNIPMDSDMCYGIKRGDLMIIILMAIKYAKDNGYIDSSYADDYDLFSWFESELKDFVSDNYQ